MKMILRVPGSDARGTCPDCKQSYAVSSGHACTSKKAKS